MNNNTNSLLNFGNTGTSSSNQQEQQQQQQQRRDHFNNFSFTAQRNNNNNDDDDVNNNDNNSVLPPIQGIPNAVTAVAQDRHQAKSKDVSNNNNARHRYSIINNTDTTSSSQQTNVSVVIGGLSSGIQHLTYNNNNNLTGNESRNHDNHNNNINTQQNRTSSAFDSEEAPIHSNNNRATLNVPTGGQQQAMISHAISVSELDVGHVHNNNINNNNSTFVNDNNLHSNNLNANNTNLQSQRRLSAGAVLGGPRRSSTATSATTFNMNPTFLFQQQNQQQQQMQQNQLNVMYTRRSSGPGTMSNLQGFSNITTPRSFGFSGATNNNLQLNFNNLLNNGVAAAAGVQFTTTATTTPTSNQVNNNNNNNVGVSSQGCYSPSNRDASHNNQQQQRNNVNSNNMNNNNFRHLTTSEVMLVIDPFKCVVENTNLHHQVIGGVHPTILNLSAKIQQVTNADPSYHLCWAGSSVLENNPNSHAARAAAAFVNGGTSTVLVPDILHNQHQYDNNQGANPFSGGAASDKGYNKSNNNINNNNNNYYFNAFNKSLVAPSITTTSQVGESNLTRVTFTSLTTPIHGSQQVMMMNTNNHLQQTPFGILSRRMSGGTFHLPSSALQRKSFGASMLSATTRLNNNNTLLPPPAPTANSGATNNNSMSTAGLPPAAAQNQQGIMINHNNNNVDVVTESTTAATISRLASPNLQHQLGRRASSRLILPPLALIQFHEQQKATAHLFSQELRLNQEERLLSLQQAELEERLAFEQHQEQQTLFLALSMSTSPSSSEQQLQQLEQQHRRMLQQEQTDSATETATQQRQLSPTFCRSLSTPAHNTSRSNKDIFGLNNNNNNNNNNENNTNEKGDNMNDASVDVINADNSSNEKTVTPTSTTDIINNNNIKNQNQRLIVQRSVAFPEAATASLGSRFTDTFKVNTHILSSDKNNGSPASNQIINNVMANNKFSLSSIFQANSQQQEVPQENDNHFATTTTNLTASILHKYQNQIEARKKQIKSYQQRCIDQQVVVTHQALFDFTTSVPQPYRRRALSSSVAHRALTRQESLKLRLGLPSLTQLRLNENNHPEQQQQQPLQTSSRTQSAEVATSKNNKQLFPPCFSAPSGEYVGLRQLGKGTFGDAWLVEWRPRERTSKEARYEKFLRKRTLAALDEKDDEADRIKKAKEDRRKQLDSLRIGTDNTSRQNMQSLASGDTPSSASPTNPVTSDNIINNTNTNNKNGNPSPNNGPDPTASPLPTSSPTRLRKNANNNNNNNTTPPTRVSTATIEQLLEIDPPCGFSMVSSHVASRPVGTRIISASRVFVCKVAHVEDCDRTFNTCDTEEEIRARREHLQKLVRKNFENISVNQLEKIKEKRIREQEENEFRRIQLEREQEMKLYDDDRILSLQQQQQDRQQDLQQQEDNNNNNSSRGGARGLASNGLIQLNVTSSIQNQLDELPAAATSTTNDKNVVNNNNVINANSPLGRRMGSNALLNNLPSKRNNNNNNNDPSIVQNPAASSKNYFNCMKTENSNENYATDINLASTGTTTTTTASERNHHRHSPDNNNNNNNAYQRNNTNSKGSTVDCGQSEESQQQQQQQQEGDDDVMHILLTRAKKNGPKQRNDDGSENNNNNNNNIVVDGVVSRDPNQNNNNNNNLNNNYYGISSEYSVKNVNGADISTTTTATTASSQRHQSIVTTHHASANSNVNTDVHNSSPMQQNIFNNLQNQNQSGNNNMNNINNISNSNRAMQLPPRQPFTNATPGTILNNNTNNNNNANHFYLTQSYPMSANIDFPFEASGGNDTTHNNDNNTIQTNGPFVQAESAGGTSLDAYSASPADSPKRHMNNNNNNNNGHYRDDDAFNFSLGMGPAYGGNQAHEYYVTHKLHKKAARRLMLVQRTQRGNQSIVNSFSPVVSSRKNTANSNNNINHINNTNTNKKPAAVYNSNNNPNNSNVQPQSRLASGGAAALVSADFASTGLGSMLVNSVHHQDGLRRRDPTSTIDRNNNDNNNNNNNNTVRADRRDSNTNDNDCEQQAPSERQSRREQPQQESNLGGIVLDSGNDQQEQPQQEHQQQEQQQQQRQDSASSTLTNGHLIAFSSSSESNLGNNVHKTNARSDPASTLMIDSRAGSPVQVAGVTPRSDISAGKNQHRHNSNTAIGTDRHEQNEDDEYDDGENDKDPSQFCLAPFNPAVMHHNRHCREDFILSNLAYPLITSYVESFYSSDNRLHLVMEYVSGGTLRNEMDRCYSRGNYKMPERTINFLIVQILLALEYLHARNIVHRDLKASNILLTRTHVIKLADFGLSAHLEDGAGMLEPGTPVGTPEYIAPETYVRSECGPKADIWAVGIILYQLLTYDKPFFGTSHEEIRRAIVSGIHPPVENRRPDISPETKQLLESMLRRNPAKRCTARQVLSLPVMQVAMVDFLNHFSSIIRPSSRLPPLANGGSQQQPPDAASSSASVVCPIDEKWEALLKEHVASLLADNEKAIAVLRSEVENPAPHLPIPPYLNTHLTTSFERFDRKVTNTRAENIEKMMKHMQREQRKLPKLKRRLDELRKRQAEDYEREINFLALQEKQRVLNLQQQQQQRQQQSFLNSNNNNSNQNKESYYFQSQTDQNILPVPASGAYRESTTTNFANTNNGRMPPPLAYENSRSHHNRALIGRSHADSNNNDNNNNDNSNSTSNRGVFYTGPGAVSTTSNNNNNISTQRQQQMQHQNQMFSPTSPNSPGYDPSSLNMGGSRNTNQNNHNNNTNQDRRYSNNLLDAASPQIRSHTTLMMLNHGNTSTFHEASSAQVEPNHNNESVDRGGGAEATGFIRSNNKDITSGGVIAAANSDVIHHHQHHDQRGGRSRENNNNETNNNNVTTRYSSNASFAAIAAGSVGGNQEIQMNSVNLSNLNSNNSNTTSRVVNDNFNNFMNGNNNNSHHGHHHHHHHVQNSNVNSPSTNALLDAAGRGYEGGPESFLAANFARGDKIIPLKEANPAAAATAAGATESQQQQFPRLNNNNNNNNNINNISCRSSSQPEPSSSRVGEVMDEEEGTKTNGTSTTAKQGASSLPRFQNMNEGNNGHPSSHQLQNNNNTSNQQQNNNNTNTTNRRVSTNTREEDYTASSNSDKAQTNTANTNTNHNSVNIHNNNNNQNDSNNAKHTVVSTATATTGTTTTTSSGNNNNNNNRRGEEQEQQRQVSQATQSTQSVSGTSGGAAISTGGGGGDGNGAGYQMLSPSLISQMGVTTIGESSHVTLGNNNNNNNNNVNNASFGVPAIHLSANAVIITSRSQQQDPLQQQQQQQQQMQSQGQSGEAAQNNTNGNSVYYGVSSPSSTRQTVNTNNNINNNNNNYNTNSPQMMYHNTNNNNNNNNFSINFLSNNTSFTSQHPRQ